MAVEKTAKLHRNRAKNTKYPQIIKNIFWGKTIVNINWDIDIDLMCKSIKMFQTLILNVHYTVKVHKAEMIYKTKFGIFNAIENCKEQQGN